MLPNNYSLLCCRKWVPIRNDMFSKQCKLLQKNTIPPPFHRTHALLRVARNLYEVITKNWKHADLLHLYPIHYSETLMKVHFVPKLVKTTMHITNNYLYEIVNALMTSPHHRIEHARNSALWYHFLKVEVSINFRAVVKNTHAIEKSSILDWWRATICR